jgi:hypothetical protein
MSAPVVERCRFEPADTQRENELICEKLLGWIAWQEPGESLGWKNLKAHPGEILDTPDFSDWAEAGLILDALSSADPTLGHSEGKWDCYGDDPYESFFHAYADTGPLAIRAAALEYLKAQS